MERIGIAISRPHNGRQSVYGIYAVLEAYGIKIENPRLRLRYEGYIEGDTQVGLPSAGPNASHMQPFIDFYPHERKRIFGPGEPKSVPAWETIRFFKEGPWQTLSSE